MPNDTFVLSSDSESEEPPPKRRSIEGVPKSFQNDRKMRFSFGVSNATLSPVSVSPLRNQQDAPKTPATLRRRSVSMSSVSNTHSMLRSSRREKYNFNELSSDSEAGEEEEEEEDRNIGFREEEPSVDLNLRALLSPAKKKIKKSDEVQNEFYGVYCLISRSDRPCYKNRCYIGYTVDPNRRINQHNGGRGKGGAKKTDSRGPWDMVCVVHGFPNHVAALRFEWAWQNPNVSKCLKGRQLKKERKETPFAYQLRIACELINSDTFNRFALTFRWLITKEELPFPTSCLPPEHMKVRHGKVKKEMSLIPSTRDDFVEMGECRICGKDIDKLWSLVRCLSVTCPAHFHSKCLAENGLKTRDEFKNHVFPLKSNCPTCGDFYLWGDVVREQRRVLKVSSKCRDEFREMVVRKGIVGREISPPI